MALFRKKPNKTPPLIKINVGIDDRFTVKEKSNIIEALIRWQDGTNGLVLFHIGNMSIDKLIMHDDDCYTWYAINIVKTHSHDEEIKKEERILGHRVNGLAIYLDVTTFAFIVVDRLQIQEDFIGLVMHEVGHLLGLAHRPAGTIMCKYAPRPAEVTYWDFSQLMDVLRRWLGLAAY